ncbi:hypothetical protein QR680_012001 [Steinernema hermaphroditum]|uniref:Uncharacterized protein n=1 Tax=Steinernema hermaphroditum TaxID=289476 RepID=A0AA39I310_9BILA|nr:hypothetical protein QR680_012001 [Steinernema hermaphroditum]
MVTNVPNMSAVVNVTEGGVLLTSVVPAYYNDAVLICVLTAVALLPNVGVLLYVFLRRHKLLKQLETRNIRQAITFMTGANVLSIIGFQSILIFYFLSLHFDWKLDFVICSGIRNFKQMIVSPAFYSCLVVAIERYVLIFFGFNMCPQYVFGMYVFFGAPHLGGLNCNIDMTKTERSTLVFHKETLVGLETMSMSQPLKTDATGREPPKPASVVGFGRPRREDRLDRSHHIVMFISQQAYYTIHIQNICGYTKVSKIKQLEDVVNVLYVVYPFIAILLNLRMMLFVIRYKVRVAHVVRNVQREKHVLMGLMVQAILPIITTTPENTMYFLYVNGIEMSKGAWRAADAIYCCFLTLNPIVTVMFVPHFRNIIIKKITTFSF